MFKFALCAVLLLLNSPLGAAAPIHIAVATNFTSTLKILSAEFTQRTEIPVLISSGSTGKLYAQIRNGAPYDIFLAADKARPQHLQADGLITNGSRFTYALGMLVVWSLDIDKAQGLPDALNHAAMHRIAIANPKTAPYGVAAQQTLQALGLWDTVGKRAVRGENVGQTFQFAASGNVDFGFIALAQTYQAGAVPESYWMIPAGLYAPLEQQAVLLQSGKSQAGGQRFLAFLQSPWARDIIRTQGYGLPK